VGIDFENALDGTNGDQVVIQYRLDENCSVDDFESDWTTLGTMDSTNYQDIMYGISDRARVVQFRFNLKTTVGQQTAGDGPFIRRIRIY